MSAAITGAPARCATMATPGATVRAGPAAVGRERQIAALLDDARRLGSARAACRDVEPRTV
jgi:hypothetical protein